MKITEKTKDIDLEITVEEIDNIEDVSNDEYMKITKEAEYVMMMYIKIGVLPRVGELIVTNYTEMTLRITELCYTDNRIMCNCEKI